MLEIELSNVGTIQPVEALFENLPTSLKRRVGFTFIPMSGPNCTLIITTR